ncbi:MULTISPECIES: hypothetical protein [Achromobacter]|nr:MULTISPECIES: hypothetical protein [Achromobacter]
MDLVIHCLLVAAPGSTVRQVRQRAAEDEMFDPALHAITEVQWVGDEAAILERTVALCAMPSGDPASPYVMYGPFRDGNLAERWLDAHFPTTAPQGHVLYPIPNAFSLGLHTWNAEMQGVLGNRLAEIPCRFGDPKQKLMPARRDAASGVRRRAEPAFEDVRNFETGRAGDSFGGTNEQEAQIDRLLNLTAPPHREEARRIILDLQRRIAQKA